MNICIYEYRNIYIYIATNNMPLASDPKSTCIFVHNFIFHMILRVSTVVSPLVSWYAGGTPVTGHTK